MPKIVVANWKMNPSSVKEAALLFKQVYPLAPKSKNIQIIICPPLPFLTLAPKNQKIRLGAQNVAKQEAGSYTGEVSAKMLTSLGVSFVIIGHSERRTLGETNEDINQKILIALKAKLNIILCLGEVSRDHDGQYLSLVENQIKESLFNVKLAQIKNIMIAYEPIWAIGQTATREATPAEFTEMKIFIRKIIADLYNSKIAHSLPIIYGGSVNPQNAKSFVEEGGADGLLIGRDSLNVKKFGAIIKTLI